MNSWSDKGIIFRGFNYVFLWEKKMQVEAGFLCSIYHYIPDYWFDFFFEIKNLPFLVILPVIERRLPLVVNEPNIFIIFNAILDYLSYFVQIVKIDVEYIFPSVKFTSSIEMKL